MSEVHKKEWRLPSYEVAEGVAVGVRIMAWILNKDILAMEGERWGGAFIKVEYRPDGEHNGTPDPRYQE